MIILAYIVISALTPLTLLYAVAGINISPKSWRKYMPWLIFALGMIAYGMQSKVEIDLDRYFQMADEIGRLPFLQIFNYEGNRGTYSGMWVMQIIFWIAGRLQIVHILPFTTACIVYGITFYITCDVAEQYEACNIIPRIMAIQMSILPFFSIISNIRNVTAFALVILAVYLDTVKKKRNLIVLMLYVFPIFVHSAAIILLLLRIGLKFGTKAKVLWFSLVCILPIIIDTLYTYIDFFAFGGSFNAVIKTSILKGYWYLHDKDETAWARQVASSKYQLFNRTVMAAFAVVMIILICLGISRIAKDKYHLFITYEFLLSIVTLSCSWFTAPHYWRFTVASVIAAGAILVPLFSSSESLEKPWLFLLRKCLVLIAIIGIPLQLWPMQYSVDFQGWFENVLLNNIYVVIIQIIKGLFLA